MALVGHSDKDGWASLLTGAVAVIIQNSRKIALDKRQLDKIPSRRAFLDLFLLGTIQTCGEHKIQNIMLKISNYTEP